MSAHKHDFGSDEDFRDIINKGFDPNKSAGITQIDLPGWEQHIQDPNACPNCGRHEDNQFSIIHPAKSDHNIERLGVCVSCDHKWVDQYARGITYDIKAGKPVMTLRQFVQRLVYCQDLTAESDAQVEDGTPGWVFRATSHHRGCYHIEDVNHEKGRFLCCVLRTDRLSDDLSYCAELIYQWAGEQGHFSFPADWEPIDIF